MRIFPANFDKLFFTESCFGAAAIDGNVLQVPVKDLFALKGHPLLIDGDGPYAGLLVFRGVTHSYRKVVEYVGDTRAPQGFKTAYGIEDGPFPQGDGKSVFKFEGLQLEPRAWIDWDIHADTFELQVDK
jgi:hypothetical protein